MTAPDAIGVADLLAQPRLEILPLPGVVGQTWNLPPDATVTVTCSPSRGLEPTLALVDDLAASGLSVVPHLAARQVRDERHLTSILGRLHAAGVSDVFVVGGDVPTAAGDFASGLDLLEAMTAAGAGFERIGVPAYPEGHPRIDDATLFEALRAKQPHASYLVTQMSFDAAAILTWLRQARAAGIHLPAYLGLPGLVDAAALLRTALRIGVGDSKRFLSGHHRLARGLFEPHVTDDLARALADRLEARDEVVGVHLYTFNRVAPTAAWLTSTRGELTVRPPDFDVERRQPREVARLSRRGGVITRQGFRK